MSKSENLLVKFLIALAGITIGVVVVLTVIAYQIGVEELEKPNRIAIISGLLSMVGGIAGAFGAYMVASHQLNKQFEHEKRKEERQRYEVLEQSLKRLELLSEVAIEFVEDFNEEFNKQQFYTDSIRNTRLKFVEDELKWIVNSLNNIDHGILMEDYGLDYLRFSRELHYAYVDIAGINFIPSHQIDHNLPSLIETLLVRGEKFKSLNTYLNEEIKYIQKQIESII